MRFYIISIILFFTVIDCGAKTIIAPSDITFVGGARVQNAAFEYPKGLTHRYDNGTLKFYLLSGGNNKLYKGRLFEFTLPVTLKQSGTFNPITNVVNYGDVFQDKLVDTIDNASGAECPPYVGIAGNATTPSGILWDTTTSRLYWTKTISYTNTVGTSDTCIGYSTIDFDNHTGAGVGIFSISPPAPSGIGNRWTFSLTEIPSTFASTYTAGKRLGLGFGGAVSIISKGPPSMGPALVAIDPPDITYDTHLGQITRGYSELLMHPWSTTLDTPLRAERVDAINNQRTGDGDYIGVTTAWNTSDTSYHGKWIDSINKHGIVVIAHLAGGNAESTVSSVQSPTIFTVVDAGDSQAGDIIRVATDYNPNPTYPFETKRISAVNGNQITLTTALTGTPSVGARYVAGTWYEGGGSAVSRWRHALYIYDPGDLAKVALGELSYNEVMPVYKELIDFPGISYPIPGTPGGTSAPSQIAALDYDSTTGRLYVEVSTGNVADIYIYQINLGANSNVLFNGTGQIPLSGSGTMTLQ